MSADITPNVQTEIDLKDESSLESGLQQDVETFKDETADNDNVSVETDGSYTGEYFETDGAKVNPTLSSYMAIPDPVAPTPILNGRYCIDGDTCHFKGIWGMGMNYKTDGITSEFHYTMRRPLSSDNPDGPQSGYYSGFFWMKVHPPKRIVENKLLLQFIPSGTQYLVTGSGSNRLGIFNVKGKYNPETTEMSCMKIYSLKKTPIPVRTTKQTSSYTTSPSEYVPTQSTVTYTDTSKDYRSFHRHATPSFLRESSDLPEGLSDEMKLCYKVLLRLMNHKWAAPFLEPVDIVKLNIPDYFDIIKDPMDFTTLQKQVANRIIITSDGFASATRRVFDNAIRYNKPQDDVHIMAKALSELFEKEYAQMTRHGIFEDYDDPPSPVYKRKPMKRPSTSFSSGHHHFHSMKRPLSQSFKLPSVDVAISDMDPVQISCLQKLYYELSERMQVLERKMSDLQVQVHSQRSMQPAAGAADKQNEALKEFPPLSVEEKKTLSERINSLTGPHLVAVVNIITEDTPLGDQTDEIVVDLDALSNETLRKLQSYVQECCREELPSHRPRTANSTRMLPMSSYVADDDMLSYSEEDG